MTKKSFSPEKPVFDVIVLGAGAAGLMCAVEAGKRGRSVLVLERNNLPGRKIRISGGGRCNFTNLQVTPSSYISGNPDFTISALKRYTPHQFIRFVEQHEIDYYEKKLGQPFCKGSAQLIIDMLLSEARDSGVRFEYGWDTTRVDLQNHFVVRSSHGEVKGRSLVVATGGVSLRDLGATRLGYEIAAQFGLKLTPLKPGLVPLTFRGPMLKLCKKLAGVSLECRVHCGEINFLENILFTHHGLSGPAILQISSYWEVGKAITIDLLPQTNIYEEFLKSRHKKILLRNFLHFYLPARFVDTWLPHQIEVKALNKYSNRELQLIAEKIHNWELFPSGTEGYQKAEVTVGGVDTTELSSETMESKKVPGLYFIGEVVDVTGWLGGYNFQWAWSSGYVAGQFV